MELDSNAHSVFLLHCHLVLVVKYRRRVFDNKFLGRTPKTEISKFINAYKSASSKLLSSIFSKFSYA